MMDVLVGALENVAIVVAVGGAAKLVAPDSFASTLRTLGLPGGRGAARLSGVAELVLGVAAVVVGGVLLALAIATLYVAFTGVVWVARRRGAVSCGCFGAADAPPGPVHVAVNAVSALVAGAAAITSPAGLTDVLADQPVAGVPYLVALALGTWMVVVLDTTGAELWDRMADVRRLGPTFRDNSSSGAR